MSAGSRTLQEAFIQSVLRENEAWHVSRRAVEDMKVYSLSGGTCTAFTVFDDELGTSAFRLATRFSQAVADQD